MNRKFSSDASDREIADARDLEDGFLLWKERFKSSPASAGIPEDLLDATISRASLEPQVIKRLNNQSEFTSSIWNYLDSAVSPKRIAAGKDALAAHREDLKKIERRFGVEGSILVAIWGIESDFGACLGDMPVVNSLATLAFYSNRKAFFEAELADALGILAKNSEFEADWLGSWAGAFGHTQFMPSSFLRFAVSLDGGEASICGKSPVDALASTANYLKAYGWLPGQPWGVEITLPPSFDYLLADGRIEKSSEAWNRLGIRRTDNSPLPDFGNSSIVLPAGSQGPGFAAFSNFRVIGAYNRSLAYMIAVGHLADRVKGEPPFAREWPRLEPPLSSSLVREMQSRLTSLGFDTKSADGIAGPNTMASIRMFQARENLVPDGFATLGLLERLRCASTSL
ncbi:MAG: lytic murein transglycosylase [Albidovulum sp.]|nr:lytic murein transglycosylase [Albidovulum sp.]